MMISLPPFPQVLLSIFQKFNVWACSGGGKRDHVEKNPKPFISSFISKNENILEVVKIEHFTALFNFWKYQDLAEFSRAILQNSVFPAVVVSVINEKLHELFTKKSVCVSCNFLQQEKLP